MYNNILEPLKTINDIVYCLIIEIKFIIKQPLELIWPGYLDDNLFELKERLGQTEESVQRRIALLYKKDIENFNDSERNLLNFEIADKIDQTQSLLDSFFDSIKTLQADRDSNTNTLKNVIEKGSLYYIEVSQMISLIKQTVTKSTQGEVDDNSKNIKLSEQTVISKPLKVALNPENQKNSIMDFDIQNFRIVRYVSSICEFLGELYTKKTSEQSIPSNFQDDALEIIYSEFRTIDTEGLKNRLALYFTQDTQSLTLSEYELYCNKVKEDIEYCDLILYQFGNEFEEDNKLDFSFCQIRNTINTEIRKKDFYFYQTGQKIHPSSNLFELIKEMEVWIIRILFFMKNLAIDGEKFESIINSNSSNTISKKLKKLFGKIAEIDSKYEDEDESDPGHSISRIIETFGYVEDKPKHLDEVTSSLGVFVMSLTHGTDGANIPTELALRVLFEKNTKEMNLEEIQFYKQNLLNEYTRVDSKYKELLDECKKWSEYINTEDEEIFFIWGVNRIGEWPEFETAFEERFKPLLSVIGSDKDAPIKNKRENEEFQKLSVATQPINNGKESTLKSEGNQHNGNNIIKLKWLGTPSQFGYIIQELIGKGFIEKPTRSYKKDAEVYLSIFDIDTKQSTLEKEISTSENQNSLSEENREKIKISHINSLK
ncbi:MAG: hypothetical protein JNM21_07060 [Taibaiella sp.]|nr:hypothetical protein [Taibaiella sp.]